MAECPTPRSLRQGDRGFTLIEMLAAIAILSFGLSGLVALLSAGVDTRSTAELRDRAVRAADVVFLDVEHRVLAQLVTPDPGAEQEDVEPLAAVTYDPVPGFPRLRAVVEFADDVDYPDLVLTRARITWLEEGVALGETFQRILYRGASFPARVARIRSSNP